MSTNKDPGPKYVPPENKKVRVRTTITLDEDWGDGMSIKLLEQTENVSHTIRQLMRYGCRYIKDNHLPRNNNQEDN